MKQANKNTQETLLDKLAMMAMQGLLSNSNINPNGMNFDEDYLSRISYKIASSMIKVKGEVK